MNRAILILLLPAVLLIAASPGIRPRADAQSYPVHQEQPEYSIGAVIVPPDQVKKMFKLDLNHAGYVVVEVGVYPAPGKDVDLYPTDFTLNVGNQLTGARPVDADTVAELAVGKDPDTVASSPHDVNTSVRTTIGHGTYTDPTTGRRSNGTYTDAEAGVGVGGPASQSCRAAECPPTTWPAPPVDQPSKTQTRNSISQDLWEKSLPDGKTVHAVAGYLYFPKPSKKQKDAAWNLRYENADAKVQLTLPSRAN